MEDYYKFDQKDEQNYKKMNEEEEEQLPPDFMPPDAEKNTTLSLTSMILGIFGISFSFGCLFIGLFFGIPAVICGHMARGKVKRGEAGGNGFAIAGLITGYLSILFNVALTVIIVIFMMIPELQKSHSAAEKVKCKNNLRQIGMAIFAYASDNNDVFPPFDGVKGFNILIEQNYIEDPKIFICPECDTKPAESGQPLTEKTCDYRYFSGKTFDSPIDTILASDKDNNHSDGTKNFFYIDGHVDSEDEFVDF